MTGKESFFNCLDPTSEITITNGDLPHWYQPGTAIFVTFRTADSMPAEVMERWQRELEHWLEARGLPLDLATQFTRKERLQTEFARLTPLLLREIRRQRDRLWHRYLDEGNGECLLRDAKLAAIVGDALRFYDGEKYDLDRFVVMPNHVHAIVQFRRGQKLDVISQSWLRYSARQIHRELKRSGVFWQGEPFDHLIRSPGQFEYLRRYIADNPAKAKLNAGEFLYWQQT